MPGLLWVDAFAATVGTNFVMMDSLLRAPKGESDATLPQPPYALDLSTADIDCDLSLQSRVILEGGLKMRDARVGGSVWCQGLYVTDGETDASRSEILHRDEFPRDAFRLQSTRVQGELMLSVDISRIKESGDLNNRGNKEVDESSYPMGFWCIGNLNLYGVQVNGSILLDGAHVTGEGAGYIDLRNARVHADLKAEKTFLSPVFDRIERPLYLALEAKTLYLSGCRVSGDCRLHMRKTLQTPVDAIWADGLSIEGNLTISGLIKELRASGLTVGRTERSLHNNLQMRTGRSRNRREARPRRTVDPGGNSQTSRCGDRRFTGDRSVVRSHCCDSQTASAVLPRLHAERDLIVPRGRYGAAKIAAFLTGGHKTVPRKGVKGSPSA